MMQQHNPHYQHDNNNQQEKVPPMRPRLSDDLFEAELLDPKNSSNSAYLDRLKTMLHTNKQHLNSEGQPVNY